MISAGINIKRGEHVAHFYRGDDELAETVAAYLAEAVVERGAAVAITTEPHHLAIERRLAAVGVDVQAATDDGRLVFLDAGATLAKLITDGQIDPEAFEREVGSTVRTVGERVRVARAYGEMVDLLWRAGQIDGAIELERLWNDLIEEQRFPLLCAYHSEMVAVPECEHALREVCQLHSSLSVSRDFEPGCHAPSAARRFVEDSLRGWGYRGSIVDDARLVISELVTNAVVHARSQIAVSVCSRHPTVRLAVDDEGRALPQTDGRSLDGHGGRGLQIVASLAHDWGVVTTPPGKIVWAELSQA